MQSHLHIISFDIPYPANYGGAIDVFHKIRCLQAQGIKVILHCFEYGNRKHARELEKICECVYYYKRDTSLINHFSSLPFNVKSRIHPDLKKNLLKDTYPILFEVLHTCYLLNDPDLKDRKKLFRHSNIEHEYFSELANGEKSLLKKIYLQREASKLKRFEKQIVHADYILSVSETDLVYFKNTYPNTPSVYLPSFHPFDDLQIKTGQGDYILYHGNLSISENYNAALWLIKHVFSKITIPVIIAGLNPPKHLIEAIQIHQHITLKPNCSEPEMQALITNAHIHCLYTAQATGLKLKLLNVLYSGRFVIANSNMLAGTDLKESCVLANNPQEYVEAIESLFSEKFTQEETEKRKSIIASMNNSEKTKKLIALLA
ncbi:MAG: mannosyltransferase [Bacteroidetes bacterium]|nr:mannosyltransferase [Bacteroidota bacterium]MDF2451961.1 mannosyltransferase [Bacteroidota bacterium]